MSLIIKSILLLYIYTTMTYALDIKKVTKELQLKAGTKASVQWKRVFSSPRHMKRYKIDTLNLRTRELLKEYLIQHAADSDQPIVQEL